ncbi:MAG: 1-acyl-sn-glycerol-3-phosphate acyltransferase [Acidimicrobiia bacterium]|nr:1-acyl-sn-glycerol-3-phosphate acyltransferase [Acidimicrobiia bacterium]
MLLQKGAASTADADRLAATTDARSRSSSAVDAIAATQNPISRSVYAGLRQLTRILSRGWRLTIEGTEHVPSTGPAILAANHVSFLDSPLLMFELPRRVWFFGKAEYLDSALTRSLFPALGMIPVERGGRRAALTAMRSGLRVLDGGQLLGIYPEGTRSRDGQLHRGHTGLAWLAFKSGAPIVPIGIRGTDVVQPPGRRFPSLRGDCSIHIGRPLATQRYESRDRRSHRILTDDVMFEISQLSGQRYVDSYAELAGGDDSKPEDLTL